MESVTFWFVSVYVACELIQYNCESKRSYAHTNIHTREEKEREREKERNRIATGVRKKKTSCFLLPLYL